MAPGLGCTLEVGNEEHLSQEERSSCQATYVSLQTPPASAWHQLPQPSEQEKWHRPGMERKADPRLSGEMILFQVSPGLKESCWQWPLSHYPHNLLSFPVRCPVLGSKRVLHIIAETFNTHLVQDLGFPVWDRLMVVTGWGHVCAMQPRGCPFLLAELGSYLVQEKA